MIAKLQNLRLRIEGGWDVVIRTDDAESFLEWLYGFEEPDPDTRVTTLFDSRYEDLEFSISFVASDRTATAIKLAWK